MKNDYVETAIHDFGGEIRERVLEEVWGEIANSIEDLVPLAGTIDTLLTVEIPEQGCPLLTTWWS
jgi:hypothetical protein